MVRGVRLLAVLALLGVGRAAGFAADAPPAAAALGQGASVGVQTIKANAQLVVVDVVVTDSHQMPVHGLKASDFAVMENGAAQQVTGFEEHVSLAPGEAAKIAPMPPMPAGIFTNFTPAPPGSAVNVLLLDALNTHMKDQSYVLDELREFLKNTPAGTRVAIFALNNRLVMLHGFTSDLTALKAAVDRTGTSASALLATTGAEDAVGNGGSLTVAKVMGGVAGGDMGQVIASMGRQTAAQSADALELQLNITLTAMSQLAHYLAGIPGRKNLIWFVGSYPEHFGSKTPQDEALYRATTNLLARSRVSVYPIGVQGLTTNAAPIGNDPSGVSGRGLAGAQRQFAQGNADQSVELNQIAAETGGHAYLDTNGLSAAVGKAIANGANYYTLSYVPTDARQNGEFHKIQVKLAQQGLSLTYRNGYYADDADAVAHRGTESGGVPSQRGALGAAMMRGAPDATEILMKLQVLPASGAVEQAVVKGNVVNPNPAAKLKIKGPYRRYAIDIAADAKDIEITPTADGHYEFSTELITYVYDAGGAVVNMAVEKARGNLTLSSYANMRRVGLPFHQEISVPANGEYYIRTSLLDLATDRYGAVEIPVASIAKLTPVSAALPGR